MEPLIKKFPYIIGRLCDNGFCVVLSGGGIELLYTISNLYEA